MRQKILVNTRAIDGGLKVMATLPEAEKDRVMTVGQLRELLTLLELIVADRQLLVDGTSPGATLERACLPRRLRTRWRRCGTMNC